MRSHDKQGEFVSALANLLSQRMAETCFDQYMDG
jgi:hypothetical protein